MNAAETPELAVTIPEPSGLRMSDVIDRLNAAFSGRYVVDRELGEGGMATVYLAEDLKHHRKVALKVLRPELAAMVGAERFLAEIETTANLQHPHILPLYDSGEADSFLFYVMPYVEGETLRQRLDREKQLPVDDAVRIATAVAGALDYAHRRGVVHRDVKPGNILMQDGQPLVGDFGIALAVGAAGGTRLTETGLSVGTPYYMSPEQATGDQTVGPPSDIYALGAVLYELLTGEPPYLGATAQAVLGRIIQGEPVSATAVRGSVPANVDAAIRRSLEKLPADRFTGAREFARALADPGFRHGAEVGATPTGSRWNGLSVGLAALAAVLALVAAWPWLRPASSPPAPVRRFSLRTSVGEGIPIPTEWLTLSEDGNTMVMSYPDPEGHWRLWLRQWSHLTATSIREAALEAGSIPTDPVLSPEGNEVAYFERGETLKVVPLDGGLVRTLATDANCCARWGDDGFIYFSNTDRRIQRVPAAGGAVEDVTAGTSSDGGPEGYFQMLPGGGVGVFTEWSPARIVAIRLSTGQRKILTPGLRSWVTPTGHLVFATQDGRLLAAPFDAEALELTAPPVPLVEDLGVRNSDAMYALSRSGTLLYWRNRVQAARAEFVWMGRNGGITPAGSGESIAPGSARNGWSLSPDGNRVAYRDEAGGGSGDIWVENLESGSRSRLTFDPAEDDAPEWSSDGDTVFFLSDRAGAGGRDVWGKRADGVGSARLVARADRSVLEFDRSADGTWLVLRVAGPPSQDIFALRPGRDTVARPLLASPDFDEILPTLSPDGRWLAYLSNETGTVRVYVRPFPDVNAGRWQVTSATAWTPRWSHDGRELFYMTFQGLVAARVATGSGFRVVDTRRLFPGAALQSLIGLRGRWYDVAPDDQRFLAARLATLEGQGSEPELILVQNFFEELKERVPR